MRWPVATLGYDDAGEGFSISNNDLTGTASGNGLEVDTISYMVRGGIRRRLEDEDFASRHEALDEAMIADAR